MTWYPVAAAILLAVAYVVNQIWQRRERDLGLPVIDLSGGKDIAAAITEGYKKVWSRFSVRCTRPKPDWAKPFHSTRTPPSTFLPNRLT